MAETGYQGVSVTPAPEPPPLGLSSKQFDALKGHRWATTMHLRMDGYSQWVYRCEALKLTKGVLYDKKAKRSETVYSIDGDEATYASIVDAANALEAKGII